MWGKKMSNPKHRTPIPERQPDTIILSKEVAKEHPELVEQFDKLAEELPDFEAEIADFIIMGERMNDLVDSVPDEKTKKWWQIWKR